MVNPGKLRSALAALLVAGGSIALAQVSTYSAFLLQAADTSSTAAPGLFKDEKVRVIIRCDDIGMNHSVNMAMERVLNEGVVSAVSVMVVTPWLDEAVELLEKHPEVSVGLHSCLNSEWTPYRWGPVLPAKEVPSLVDRYGKFFGTRAELIANQPNLDEVEKELRAQVELALSKGLKLSYIDHHMGAAVTTPEMRERFERVAGDYGLAISRYFGEKPGPVWYRIPPERKPEFLARGLRELTTPGLYLVVCHPALNVPEMSVLRDLNTTLGLPNVAAHRQAETEGLCSPAVKQAIRERGIELIGYRELRERFFDQMARPIE